MLPCQARRSDNSFPLLSVREPESSCIRLLRRCALYTDSDSPTGLTTRLEVVEQISRRALLLIGAENAIVWPIEGYRKRDKQAKEPNNLVALLITHDEIHAGPECDESLVHATGGPYGRH